MADLTTEVDAYREENTRLREQIARMEELAERLDATARWGVNHPDIDVQAHALADRDLADQIRAILNGDTRD